MTTQPLVSILIAAYNAAPWITETIQSALAQTWPHKEIIVVNDGSHDRTEQIARQFSAQGVTVLTIPNGGQAAALNYAYRQSHGDFIQYLDADDLLASTKIERQLAALRDCDGRHLMLSCPWAYFYYRTSKARFVPNSLWQDLSPVEWFLREMSQPIYMPNHTWLVSRELVDAAGPWNTSLRKSKDGEFFARVLVASTGTRFVPDTAVYYRSRGSGGSSYIGDSDTQKDSLLQAIKLHIQYVRSLEESERVRKAAVAYLQLCFGAFYPSRPDLVSQAEALATELGGRLEKPQLRRKYTWLVPLLGWNMAEQSQTALPQVRANMARRLDKLMYGLKQDQENNS